MLKRNAVQKILAIILFLITTTLAAAGFDCQKASTDVERMICDKPQLSKADEKMDNAYQQLRKVLPNVERELLKQEQREWLDYRDFELLNCIKPNCEVHFYEVRIKQLGPVEQTDLNCRTQKTSVEKRICSSRLLRHADGRIIKLYNELQNELKQDGYHIKSLVLKQDQESWVRLRETELSQPYCNRRCAWRFFQRRIEFLVRYRF
ncbi:MAG: hypothetical protein DRR16_25095 [Candidatus Parabeggiatoa sp. nov. 3]|nr:MAG: hypothetical protein DRQ99_28065 [Gammaproteobacteria bacterium]RKZ79781.1 MAG: hypothetical protein DRR16_25095 [Gammaproteobacteria bacterium]